MHQLNKDRLISIVFLLAALVFVAWLPPDYWQERTVLGVKLILSGLIWLGLK